MPAINEKRSVLNNRGIVGQFGIGTSQGKFFYREKVEGQKAYKFKVIPDAKNLDEAEDIFFSRLLPLTGGKLPLIEIAKGFACEGSYYKSIRMHKSYNYISSENQAEIYKRHLINLTSIIFSIS